MRTLAEMTDRIQRYLADTDTDTYTDTLLQESYMPDAATMLWEDLLRHNRGKMLLRKTSEYTALTADQEIYDLPADILQLNTIEVRWQDSDDRPCELQKREPPRAGGYRSGTSAFLGDTGYMTGAGTHGLFWYDDCDPGQVRIWPYLTSVNEQKYRFRYYCEPEFPTVDAGTFNNADDADDDDLNLPSGLDAAVEFLTVALAAVEEIENGRPIGTFGQMYRSRLNALAAARGYPTEPKRRYIRSGG